MYISITSVTFVINCIYMVLFRHSKICENFKLVFKKYKYLGVRVGDKKDVFNFSFLFHPSKPILNVVAKNSNPEDVLLF